MRATPRTFSRDGHTTIVHVEAPEEWFDLLRLGHSLPLELPGRLVEKSEMLVVVVHEKEKPQ